MTDTAVDFSRPGEVEVVFYEPLPKWTVALVDENGYTLGTRPGAVDLEHGSVKFRDVTWSALHATIRSVVVYLDEEPFYRHDWSMPQVVCGNDFTVVFPTIWSIS
jgi:hypothetical protein